MSSHSTRSASLLCRLVRFRADWLGAEARGEGLLARHARGCAQCQQHFAAAVELEQQLRRPRALAPAEAAQHVAREERIMAALGSDLRVRRSARRSTRAWMAWAAGAAAFVLAVLVWQRNDHGLDQRSEDRPAPVPSTLTASGADNLLTPSRLGERMLAALAPAPDVLAGTPLEQEIAAVQADTRSALRFLALNFLPGPPGEPAAPRADTERQSS